MKILFLIDNLTKVPWVPKTFTRVSGSGHSAARKNFGI